MSSCDKCGSFAINDDPEKNLCDCCWRDAKIDQLQKELGDVTVERDGLKFVVDSINELRADETTVLVPCDDPNAPYSKNTIGLALDPGDPDCKPIWFYGESLEDSLKKALVFLHSLPDLS